MRTWLLGIAVVVVAAALGVGAAYGGSAVMKNYQAQNLQTVPVQQEFRIRLRNNRQDRMQERIKDQMQWFRGSDSGKGTPTP